jgi:hypothetical protein
MAKAYSGHQRRHSRITKAERLEFGKQHAPEVVPPLDHSKDMRNPAWARDAAARAIAACTEDNRSWIERHNDDQDNTPARQPADIQ